MERIIRLTETDLNRVVKRIINEGVKITTAAITIPPSASSGTFKFDAEKGLDLFDAQGKHIGTWDYNMSGGQ